MYALWDTQLDEWARLCSMDMMITSSIEDVITIAIPVFDSEEEADTARKAAYGNLYEVYKILKFV
ncbi:MAG: hypothetical protein ACYSUB_01875 [Planctomycetota bacterium]